MEPLNKPLSISAQNDRTNTSSPSSLPKQGVFVVSCKDCGERRYVFALGEETLDHWLSDNHCSQCNGEYAPVSDSNEGVFKVTE